MRKTKVSSIKLFIQLILMVIIQIVNATEVSLPIRVKIEKTTTTVYVERKETEIEKFKQTELAKIKNKKAIQFNDNEILELTAESCAKGRGDIYRL